MLGGIPMLLAAVRPKAILERRISIGFGQPCHHHVGYESNQAQRSDAHCLSETGAPAEFTNNFEMHGPPGAAEQETCILPDSRPLSLATLV
jgi:hypothetical protein